MIKIKILKTMRKSKQKKFYTFSNVVKFFILFMSICFSTVYANSTNSQTKINVNVKKAAVVDLFKKIENNSEYVFFYKDDVLKNSNKITINAKQETLSNILDKAFSNTSLSYIINDRQVVIKTNKKIVNEKITETTIAKQQQQVMGTVTDETGLPLPGVTIIVKGTNNGTTTDFDGKYTINKVTSNSVLQFSFMGYNTKEIKVDNKSVINVILSPNTTSLDEVVITGYQKINRKLFTGSAVKVKMEDVQLVGVSDVSRSLQGEVSGVEVENVSGTFGTAPVIRIRGNASINGTNKPLWVIDGVVLEDAVELTNDDITSGDLSTLLSSGTAGLNPEDIESFQVLKDASATALYGARAMNGVIVITTKKGSTGAPRISYSTNVTVRNKPSYSQFDLLDSGSEMSVYQELYEKGWIDIASANQGGNHGVLSNMFHEISKNNLNWGPGGTLNYDYLQKYANANTNWFDILFRDSFSYQNSLSISSGSEKSSMRASIGYLNDEGQTVADGVKNYTASLNADFKISDKFNAAFKLSGNIRDQKLAASEDRKFNAIDGVYERNFDINPFNYSLYSSRSITPYNDDGSLAFLRRNFAPFNILHEIDHNTLDLDISDLKFQTNLRYEFNDRLSIATTLYARWYKSKAIQSIHENSNNAEAYRADDPLIRNSNIFLFDDPASPELEPYSILPNGGFRKTTENTLTSYSIKNVLNYSPKTAENHNVGLLVGQELRYSDRGEDYFEGWGYVFDKGGLVISDPNFIRYLDDRGEDYFSVEDTRNRYWGTFANAAYSYKSKYTVNSTFTYAGDNRTGKSKKARYLPTFNVSGAWNIHNESWMENTDWINLLKLKSTYGISGDNPINASAALILRGAEPLRPHLSDRETALIIDELENSELSFEKLYEFNVGVEAGLFNNRIYTEIEYYKRQSKDLLGRIETNGVGGIQYKYGNIGEMDLEGLELSFRSVNIETENFKWTSNLTFNTTKNEITKWESRDRIGDAISRYGANLVGYPKGALFSVPFAGLDSNGVPTFYDKDGEITQELNLQEREDIIDYLKYEGSTTPKGFGGFSNSISYKNLNLSFGIVYRYGNKIRLDDAFYGNYNDYSSLPGELINRWSFPGDENITNIPAIITPLVDKYLSDNSLNPYELYNKSDLRVADGDFVRLKSLKLAYKLPKALIDKTRLTGATVSLSGYNLMLLYSDDKLNGIDPEFFQSGGVSLPLTRSYTFALNFNF